MDYKELYEQERKKYEDLMKRYEEIDIKYENALSEAELAKANLAKIKNSPVWKMTKPLRVVYFFFKRMKTAYVMYGGVIGVMKKLAHKLHQKKVQKDYGTRSFPSEEERKRQEAEVFSKNITFSILVPLYNTPEKFLREMIASVQMQTYQKWELCLADGSDDEHKYVEKICQELSDKDSRIKYRKLEKNLGISENTNECLNMATGEYIALFDHDDLLHPCALYENMRVICEENADYIYTDEVTFHGDSIDNMATMHFKPDFSPDNLLANNYICHFSVFDRKLLEQTELFRSAYDGSQDHDMILRLTGVAKNVKHIPKVLYYWRSHAGSVADNIDAKTYAIDAAKRAVRDYCKDRGIPVKSVESTRAFPTIFQLSYEISGNPLVSIVIPNKNHREDLEKCIESIRLKSTYSNYEIIIVENNSTEESIFAYYKELEQQKNIRVITYQGEFNYSKINNLGVKEAKGEYLLLLNNDIKIISPDWIEELLMHAQRKEVGAVGAKLFYPDNTIQHAGIVIGLGAHRSAGHTHYGMPKENLGYMGRLCYTQNVTAVTGACMMVKKSLYEEVGGLDEEFKVALNDVDFCLKLRKKGYLNIFTPFAEAFHFESKSRGFEDSKAKKERYTEECEHFKQKWHKELETGDPYYNPNFSLDYSDYSLR